MRLERRGRYDVFVGENGRPVPGRVRIRFVPFAGDVIASYDPALVFTDGSVALYSKQFDAFPVASVDEAERLPLDLNGSNVIRGVNKVTFRDQAGPVLHQGRRVASATLKDEGTYVLFGPAQPIVTDAMTAIIDPALPPWIKASLSRSVPQILARYAAALGPPPGPRPTVMVSWAGPTPKVSSMGGSVLPGLIIMTYEGQGVLDAGRGMAHRGLWFIGHESAHFWLGQAVRYEFSRDAWIMEGGASLLAVRTVAAIDPDYVWRAELQSYINDCVSLSAGRGVASAQERNEHRAYYACGAVFGLVAEGASRKTFVGFIRPLIEASREDRVLTRGEWLAELTRVSGDASLAADIERLLDKGAENPKAAIASLFARAGVDHRLGPDGTPMLT